MNKNIEDIVEILHAEKCSCVIYNNDVVRLYWQRGVKDLLTILEKEPSMLHGAMIADKVIGKGAAALMILGGVESIYADVISKPALELLSTVKLSVRYAESVPNIINRSGTGICPVENLCMNCKTALDCLPLIKQFIENNFNSKTNLLT